MAIITTEEREAILTAISELSLKKDNKVTILERLALRIKIIQLQKLTVKLSQVLDNPKEEK